MSSYLVIGLESSTTKLVAKLIALNLGLTDHIEKWNGNWSIKNDQHEVVHRSLPHGDASLYLIGQDTDNYDYVILVFRDWYSSLRSKMATHQSDKGLARLEHLRGRQCLIDIFTHNQELLNSKMFIFSYETAFILRRAYVELFLRNLGFDNPKYTRIKDINGKYHSF